MRLDILIIIGKKAWPFFSGMTSSEGEKVAQGQVPLKILFIDLNVMLSPKMDNLSAGRFTLETA
jgi:hypothetical protein